MNKAKALRELAQAVTQRGLSYDPSKVVKHSDFDTKTQKTFVRYDYLAGNGMNFAAGYSE